MRLPAESPYTLLSLQLSLPMLQAAATGHMEVNVQKQKHDKQRRGTVPHSGDRRRVFFFDWTV